MQQVVLSQTPWGAHCLRLGRPVPAGGPRAVLFGTRLGGSQLPGGRRPVADFAPLTGSSQQMLLGFLAVATKVLAVAGCASALSLTAKRGQRELGLTRRAEGSVSRHRPGPSSGPAGSSALPKREDVGFPEGGARRPAAEPPSPGQAMPPAFRSLLQTCTSHRHLASRSWSVASFPISFHPNIPPKPTVLIPVRGELLNRTKENFIHAANVQPELDAGCGPVTGTDKGQPRKAGV